VAEDIALNDPLLMPADASGTTQPPASRRSSLTTALWKFLPHSWNELLTITIAVVSLVISLNTSQSQNNRELREQLTDTLDHRLAISLQLQKIGQDMQATTDAKAAIKLQGDLSTLGAQDYALVAQAAELARKIPDEVMWVDYMILANGFAFSGDHRTAERYYLQTLDAAKDSAFATQWAKSTYAWFLFGQPGRIEDGRAQYEEIIDLISNMDLHDEAKRRTLVNTYGAWAQSEGSLGNYSEVARILVRGCEVARLVENPLSRTNLMNYLSRTWETQYPPIFAGVAPRCT